MTFWIVQRNFSVLIIYVCLILVVNMWKLEFKKSIFEGGSCLEIALK
jgi:hypothetical protein